MSSSPKVSVVLPSYNYAHYLVHSLNSVLNQGFRDFEVVIVDDGSLDHTRELVSSYDDPRIRYIYQENRGLAEARNTGIRASRGELIAFLDSDDVWLPQKLAKQVLAFDQNSILGMVFGQAELIDENGLIIEGGKLSIPENLPYPTLYENLLGRNIIPGPSSVILSRECLEKVGNFVHECGGVADLDMWRRVARLYPCYGVPEILAQIRIHRTSMTYARRAYMAEGMIACIQRATAEVGHEQRYQESLRFSQKRMYTHACWYFLEDAVHNYRAGDLESERHNSERALSSWASIPGKSVGAANVLQWFSEIVASACRFFVGDNQDLPLMLDAIDVLVRAAVRNQAAKSRDEKALRKRGFSIAYFYASQQVSASDSWRARNYALRALWHSPKLIRDRAWLKILLGGFMLRNISRLRMNLSPG